MLSSLRPMPRWLAGGVICLIAAVPLAAQEGQPPADPAMPTYALAFKHQAGQVQNFRASMKADMTFTPNGGGGGGLGPIPIGLNVLYASTEKITGTRQGTGTVAIKLNNLTLTANAMGQNQVIKMQNGKVTLNGQPAPAGAGNPLQQMTGSTDSVVKRDPQGNVTLVSGGGNQLAALGGGGTAGVFVQFSDKPVSVGEQWEVTQKVQAAVPGPLAGPAGGQLPQLEVKYTHILKQVVNKDGKRLAIITTTGAGGTPQEGQNAMTQDVTGTSRFDIDRGVLVSGQYTINTSMRMASPQLGGAEGQPGAPTGVQIDGMINLTVGEAPATAAKPAGKKPVGKRPVKKAAKKK